jgi:signal transduction histidine kinase
VDTLLEISLQLCTAESSGLSVLENTAEGNEVCRWTKIAGSLKNYAGHTISRATSPAALCVDRKSPQLFSNAEIFSPGLSGEALFVPVDRGGSFRGALWICCKIETGGFDSEDVRVMTALADFAGFALGLSESARVEKEVRIQKERDLDQLSARLLTLQDEERRRLGRDLHDSAGQYLAAIAMTLNMVLREPPSLSPAQVENLSTALQLVAQCTAEIRTISYLLHPPLLDELGLVSAIAWYLEGFSSRSGIHVDFDCPKELRRFSSEIETALFRIVQQGLANIHRHSQARTARIRIHLADGWVLLEIGDDGRGIPADVVDGIVNGTYLAGVGTAGMRERARMLGGHFDIRSGPAGTTLTVKLPLKD